MGVHPRQTINKQQNLEYIIKYMYIVKSKSKFHLEFVKILHILSPMISVTLIGCHF